MLLVPLAYTPVFSPQIEQPVDDELLARIRTVSEELTATYPPLANIVRNYNRDVLLRFEVVMIAAHAAAALSQKDLKPPQGAGRLQWECEHAHELAKNMTRHHVHFKDVDSLEKIVKLLIYYWENQSALETLGRIVGKDFSGMKITKENYRQILKEMSFILPKADRSEFPDEQSYQNAMKDHAFHIFSEWVVDQLQPLSVHELARVLDSIAEWGFFAAFGLFVLNPRMCREAINAKNYAAILTLAKYTRGGTTQIIKDELNEKRDPQINMEWIRSIDFQKGYSLISDFISHLSVFSFKDLLDYVDAQEDIENSKSIVSARIANKLARGGFYFEMMRPLNMIAPGSIRDGVLRFTLLSILQKNDPQYFGLAGSMVQLISKPELKEEIETLLNAVYKKDKLS